MDISEYYNIARLEESHWWYVGMAGIAKDWLSHLPTVNAAKPRVILDAGCGTGGDLKFLSEFGTAIGIDLHPLALRLSAEKGYTRLARATVEQLPFPGESIAVLTSFEVLYHLQVNDDAQALRDFARVLEPGGWLLLRLPAHDWLRGAHDRTVHTRHRYTREEVQAKLRTAGLRPVRVTYANTLLFFPAALWRLIQRGTSDEAHTDVRLPSPPVNRALTALLRAEGLWLRRFDLPIGLSVLALAQKESA
ncbi:MAG: class I SAM-dependent methyltransferase [Chloroflexi bacterium]|nr:class I SAM-dependent methyltransferase [Chloroflexota bacterium]